MPADFTDLRETEVEDLYINNTCPWCKIPLNKLEKSFSFVPWGVRERAMVTTDAQCPKCKLLFDTKTGSNDSG